MAVFLERDHAGTFTDEVVSVLYMSIIPIVLWLTSSIFKRQSTWCQNISHYSMTNFANLFSQTCMHEYTLMAKFTAYVNPFAPSRALCDHWALVNSFCFRSMTN